jgi:outer membrane protein
MKRIQNRVKKGRRVSILLWLFWVFPGVLTAQQPLTLEMLRQKAMDNNKSLEMVRNAEKAAAQLKKAAFTQFLPNINATGSYTWNEKDIRLLAEDALLPVGSKMADGSFGFTADQVSNKWTLVNGSPVPLDAGGVPFNPSSNPEKIQWKGYALLPRESLEYDIHNMYMGVVSFVQPLYMGGKIAALYKMAGYSGKLAEARLENANQELMVEVDEAYWRVISLGYKTSLAKEYRNMLSKLDSNVLVMFDEGVATRADALRVRVKLNEADIMFSKAENGLDLSRMALNQLCGLPVSDQTPLDGQEISANEAVVPEVPLEMALNSRPEIKSLVQGENLARSGERMALSRFLPNIALTGNYLLSNPNVFNGFQNKFDGMFSFGVVAAVPVFHFGERWHTLKAARLTRENATLMLEEAREKIELQINQNTFRVTENLKKQVSAGNNVALAEENLRSASEGFEAGVISMSDLMAAQTAWLSAKSEYIDAGIDVRLTNLYLKKSLGIMEIPVLNK